MGLVLPRSVRAMVVLPGSVARRRRVTRFGSCKVWSPAARDDAGPGAVRSGYTGAREPSALPLGRPPRTPGRTMPKPAPGRRRGELGAPARRPPVMHQSRPVAGCQDDPGGPHGSSPRHSAEDAKARFCDGHRDPPRLQVASIAWIAVHHRRVAHKRRSPEGALPPTWYTEDSQTLRDHHAIGRAGVTNKGGDMRRGRRVGVSVALFAAVTTGARSWPPPRRARP